MKPNRRGLEDHVIVPGILAGGVVKAPRRSGPGPLDAEPPAHPQVGDEGLAPVEVGQQVLGPTPQGDHSRPGQALDEPLREGKPQVGSAGLDARKAAAL
jgi:hypothetical protein